MAPVRRIPAEEASRALRDRAARWPDDRLPGDRLSGVAKVRLDPSFGFSRQDRVLTLGSCFAREIENRLDQLGFDLPMKQVRVPEEERQNKTENDLLNKYTIQSIENELRWASGEAAPHPEKLFVETADGLWHDPQLIHSATPLPIERVKARRALVQDAVGQFPSCRLVILTLGLAEAWWDEETGLYLNTAPPTAALRRYPGRFALDVLSYDDILASMERCWEILQARGHPDLKMLVTVSPVPFKVSFSGEDALQANTYSKAVQRAACRAFVERHAGVDYFPSYEIVTLTARELAFERDNAHVATPIVNHIMDEVLRAYAPEVEVARQDVAAPKTRSAANEGTHFDLIVLAKHHMEEGDFAAAEAACAELIARFEGRIPAHVLGRCRYLYASAFFRQRNWADAARQYELAAPLDPQDGLVHYKLGQALEKLGEHARAVAAYEQAVAMNSARAEFRDRLERARAARKSAA